MRRLLGSGIFIVIMLLIDLYVFQAVKLVSQQASTKIKLIIYGIYWAITLPALIVFLFGSAINIGMSSKKFHYRSKTFPPLSKDLKFYIFQISILEVLLILEV